MTCLATWALVAVAGAGCGKTAPPRADAQPAQASVERQPDAGAPPPPPFAASPSAELRAFGAALATVGTEEAATWLEEAERPRSADVPVPAPPDAAVAAVAALVAWDRVGGSAVPVDCTVDPDLAALAPILRLAKVARLLARTADAPELRALLRLGQELRRSHSDRLAVDIGLDLAVKNAEWFAAHGARLPPALAALGPEDDVPLRAALAENACLIAQLERGDAVLPTEAEYADGRRQLGMTGGGSLPGEIPTLLAFARETRARALAARPPAALARILAARADEAQRHPTSVLVRILGRPRPVTSEIEQLARIRALGR